MRKKTKWSLLALLYVNLLPYLSRSWGGLDWVAQYLPDAGFELVGMLFFHTFYSMPAIPLIISIWVSKTSRAPWLCTVAVVTAFTVAVNATNDLAADAQAAISLVVFPVFIMFLGFVALGVGAAIQRVRARSAE
jgi:hypothetical protein